MNKSTQLLLKGTVFALVVAILGVGGMIARYAMLGDTMATPRNETERAMYLAVQAVKANPNDADARIKLAAVYLDIGRISSALKEAKTAARLAPDDGQISYVLGMAHKAKGDMDEAAKNLKKATAAGGELAPFYQRAHLDLAKIYVEQKRYTEAIRAYDNALGYGPEEAPILYELGTVYERTGDLTSAVGYYKETLEFIPDYAEAQKALERLESEKKKSAKSAKK